LTGLEEIWLADSSISDADLQHLGRLTQLRRLTLDAAGITDGGTAPLAGLTNLQSLNLMGTSLTADSIQHLVTMQHLESLSFPAPLDDQALGWLRRLPNLKRVNRGLQNPQIGCYVTDAGLADLAKLRCLSNVSLRDARSGAELPGIDVPESADTMTDAGLAHLWEKGNLTYVQLSGHDITAAGLRWSPRLFWCHRVSIQVQRPLDEFFCCPLEVGEAMAILTPKGLSLETDKDATNDRRGPREVHFSWQEPGFQLDVLRSLPTIRRLLLRRDTRALLVGGWENLQYVPELVEFEMPRTFDSELQLDGEAIRYLSRLPQLERLVCALSENLSAEEFAPLGRSPRLAVLELLCGTLSTEHLRAIGQLERLVSLRIRTHSGSVDDDEALKHLRPLTQLRELRLDGISDVGLHSIGQIESLARLTISGSTGVGGSGRKITDEGLQHLEKLPALEYLDLRGTAVSNDGLSAFAGRHPRVEVPMKK
jgi:hypothetical protein